MDLSQTSTEDLLAQHYGGMDKVPTDVLMRVHQAAQPSAQSVSRATGPSGYAADSGAVPNPATPNSSVIQRLLNYAQKEGPPIAGGMIGGALGAPGGPLGVMGGAALGGAGGRALQRDYQYATGSRDPNSDTTTGNATDIVKSGVSQGAAAGLGLVAGAATDAVAPGIGKLGAQLIRLGSGVPVKSGEVALGDLGMLGRAPSAGQVGGAYTDFESANGVAGLRATQEAAWQDSSASDLKKMALDAARKISSQQPIDNQEAYIASQAARKVAAQAANRDPDSLAAMTSGLVGKAKDVIDTHLESVMPGYQKLRQGAFESNVGEDFSSWLPQNQNVSPNVLRGMTGLGIAGYEAKKGNPVGAAMALGGMSPYLTGLAIRAAGAAAPVAGPLAGLAASAGTQSLADSMPNTNPDGSSTIPPALAKIIMKLRGGP